MNRLGNTIDLLISSCPLNDVSVTDESSAITDQFLLKFSFPLPISTPPSRFEKNLSFRHLSAIDTVAMTNDLMTGIDSLSFDVSSPDAIHSSLCDLLSKTLDTHAPLITRSVCSRYSTPWYNDELR